MEYCFELYGAFGRVEELKSIEVFGMAVALPLPFQDVPAINFNIEDIQDSRKDYCLNVFWWICCLLLSPHVVILLSVLKVEALVGRKRAPRA